MIKIDNNVYEIEVSDVRDLFRERDRDCHKGMFGIVGIMGGSLEYSGSIKLSNMSASAMRGGAGVVRVIVPESILNSIMPYVLEETVFSLSCDDKGKIKFVRDEIDNALDRLDVICVGMGWGRSLEYKDVLEYIINNFKGPIVIDADGLNTLADMDRDVLLKCRNKIILTPHVKEMERLTGISCEEIKNNSIEVAREFAKRYNVIVLLKGSTTIVTDGELVYLSKSGCSGMATAGSGDVLSGIIVGMLGYQEASLLTVAGASYLAGIAGNLACEQETDIAMIASDTIKYIGKAIKKIRSS